MKFCQVCTSLSDIDKATEMARESINHKLAFCCWIRPIHMAMYPWKGELCEESEYEVVFKTNNVNLEQLTALIRGMHPYETPYIASFHGDILHVGYAQWAETIVT